MSKPFVYDPGTSPTTISARQLWANHRFMLETQNRVSKRYGGQRKQRWYTMLFMMHVVEFGLKCTGHYARGREHANDIRLRDVELRFAKLPPAFDGFTLLQVADPHFDGMPGIEHKMLEIIGNREFDLCVLTGDYRADVHGPHRDAMQALGRFVSGIRARHGTVGILGNHDDCHMVAPMEALGVQMLINECLRLTRQDQTLQLIGTDDVHYYYTDQALVALQAARDAFSIALIHSAELCDAAAAAGVDLYLCGHSHGGQICLPGGRPLITHLRAGRGYFRGEWQHQGMRGITSTGAGASGIPVRFNSRGELLAITLRRGEG